MESIVRAIEFEKEYMFYVYEIRIIECERELKNHLYEIYYGKNCLNQVWEDGSLNFLKLKKIMQERIAIAAFFKYAKVYRYNWLFGIGGTKLMAIFFDACRVDWAFFERAEEEYSKIKISIIAQQIRFSISKMVDIELYGDNEELFSNYFSGMEMSLLFSIFSIFSINFFKKYNYSSYIDRD